MSANQMAWVQFPCGCKWMVPPNLPTIPRNCPEHWLADKPIKVDPVDSDKLEREMNP